MALRGGLPYRYQKIESGVPLPPLEHTGGRRRQNMNLVKWSDFQVGDSVFIPEEDYGTRSRINLSSAINTQHIWSDKRFTLRMRTLEKHNEHGWRIWRIL